ncbi:hypothetical protein AGMMS49938_13470 [Fibrobacterales bacterium]|nr:hypothetical protein AGMMS49938_13470 [Fibrobacterales bacterium]
MPQIICTLTNERVKSITASLFLQLEKHIIESGMGEDKDSFETIKQRLLTPPTLNAEQFAEEAIYVILAGGFRQKTAKKKFGDIMQFINATKGEQTEITTPNLLPIFNNKNKINAIVKIWHNRTNYRDKFYSLKTDSEKLAYLGTLPHIGDITKNHLARNLGISNVKYDVWIQRLGLALAGSDESVQFPLTEDTKNLCDKMFSAIEKVTALNKGYIDVVLWKACQEGILQFR